MMSSSLEKKVALVTGGGRGIGKHISIALAKAGATVVLTYVENELTADETVQLIKGAGGQASALQMNTTDRLSVRNAMKDIGGELGKLDVLVNNAGINNPCDFDQLTDQDWDRVLNVNLKGPFICSQEALSLLSEGEGSSIINIGSVSGQYGGPRTAHYAASKAGLISLGQVVARFGADKGIRCNTVAAGIIDSDMGAQGLKSGVVSKAAESIILGRLGSPEEVAKTVVFLASDDASYITAQTINVNGGLYF